MPEAPPAPPIGGIKDSAVIKIITAKGTKSPIRLKGFKLFKSFKLLNFLKSLKIAVNPKAKIAAIQVGQVPVRAIVIPKRVKNNELRIMNIGFEAVKICITKKGISRAKIAVVEKLDPVGVKLIPCVQGEGRTFTPK